ncbi:hypothetical protein BC835DRAFT_1010546 [Cytidiella melzeri]|nr:hypothetical protein BC835DRAFT_1010546 [Cytidiella melzeri]
MYAVLTRHGPSKRGMHRKGFPLFSSIPLLHPPPLPRNSNPFNSLSPVEVCQKTRDHMPSYTTCTSKPKTHHQHDRHFNTLCLGRNFRILDLTRNCPRADNTANCASTIRRRLLVQAYDANNAEPILAPGTAALSNRQEKKQFRDRIILPRKH